ncbi:DUF3187 family protein [Shewanella indica]|uniref:DUF3187 family protein n=1 Tax=Shewanella indica TaxID=768528 RepID=UPI0009F42899
MKYLPKACWLPIFFCLPLHAELADFDDYGPLRVYAQSPLQSSSLTPMLRSGFSMVEGQKEWYLTGNMASVWAETEDYLADYYHNSLTGGLKWQIDDRWMLDANYTWRFSGNNHLDSLTMWFHDAFGFDQNGRDHQPRNQNQIYSKQHNVNISDFGGETLNNAFNIYLGYQLLQNEHHGLSVGGSLYYNYVGSGPFANENFEQALQLNYSYRNGRHNFHSTLGLSFREDEEVLSDMPYKSNALMLGLGYEYRVGRHGWMLEYHRYEGMTDADDDFSEASNEAVLGYRYYMDRSAIEFTVIENFLNMDNSADIAFTLGYRHML